MTPFDVFRRIAELERTTPDTDPGADPRRFLDLIRLIFSSARLGVWTFDPRSGVLEWDDQLLEIYGLDRASFDRRFSTWESRVLPEDLESAKAALSACVDHDDATPVTFRIRRPNGEVRTLQGWAVAERDDDGEIVTMLGVNRDVTDERRTEQALLHLQRLESLGKLTGGVAHDFNNLLAVLLGNLEMLRVETDEDRRADLVSEALDAVRRGRDLTGNLLSFARRASLRPEETDVNEHVRRTMAIVQRTLAAGIVVQVRCADALPSIEIDPSSFDTALLNLLVNAQDAMPSGGTLTVETRLETTGKEGAIVVAVRDTGRGIETHHLDRVFEPFFTTKDVGKGTGLGLSMVEGFVEQSRGHVELTSKVGEGTEVQMFFPVPASTEDPGAVTREPGGIPDARVLLVEDLASVRKVAKAQLVAAGFDVVAVETGGEAVRSFATTGFDCVVTDIVLPGEIQGPDLAARLRARVPGLPVVFMSGFVGREDVIGRLIPASDIFLRKPVRFEDLVRSVRRALAAD